MKHLILIYILFSINAFGQTEPTQNWDGFSQDFDMLKYQGGEFKFSGYVRVESENNEASARLMARVDKKKGYSFLDNMKDRPITSSQWSQYKIEGKIDDKATKLFIGAIHIGQGKFYFDSFNLEVKSRNGVWERVNIANAEFEEDTHKTDWKSFFDRGFETILTRTNPYQGNTCLLVNANKKELKGKFVIANGIKLYYEEYGKGDTLLLLHGNSESIKSFYKQIPELSKMFYIIAIDSRGQGNSTKDEKKMNYELMATDVNSFLEALKIKKVNVLGWSDGGNIGLILAMEHPDKIKRLATMGANLFNDNTSVDENITKELMTQRGKLVKQDAERNKFEIEMIDLMLNEPNINPEELEKIQCPTLIMAGSKDVIKEEHSKLIANKIKDSRLVIFDNGTHYEPVEKADRFNKTVIEFLTQLKK